ncbi:MAG: ribonuclease P protein component [Pseudomonadota bacterium]
MPHRYSFHRDMRLRTSTQFKNVFDRRCSIHGKFISVHGVQNPDGLVRLGLAVSRKVSKRAVDRNRVKRLIRESFRHCRNKLSATDFVVVAKPSACAALPIDVREELDGLWHEVQRRCER